jgi:hypothetical protein
MGRPRWSGSRLLSSPDFSLAAKASLKIAADRLGVPERREYWWAFPAVGWRGYVGDETGGLTPNQSA